MADKVISEFKIVETEDGYRIEIKGDKEQMKKWFEHRGRFGRHGMGFGPFGFMRHFWGRHHHGPWGHGPWGQGWDEEEEAPPAADRPRA